MWCQQFLPPLWIIVASFGEEEVQEGTLRSDPCGQHVKCPQLLLVFLSTQLKNNDKSKYLGPGLFWSDKFQPGF